MVQLGCHQVDIARSIAKVSIIGKRSIARFWLYRAISYYLDAFYPTAAHNLGCLWSIVLKLVTGSSYS